MQPLALLFIIMTVLCAAFLAWLHTPRGKQWRDNL